MQTFLPYKDFVESAKCLDDKRLGKQRVEALQILKALHIDDYGWQNHPAVKMWKGYEIALMEYMTCCIDEWKSRGFKNTMSRADMRLLKPSLEYPIWLGNDKLHISHKSNLLRKMPEHYSKYNWKVESDIPYYWCGFSKQDKEKTDGRLG